jgi:hypothetical protein
MLEGERKSKYRLTEDKIPFVLRRYLSSGFPDLANSDSFALVINQLGNEEGTWPVNERGAAQDAVDLAATIRSRILNGKSSFKLYGGHPGEAKREMTFPASELDGLGIEKLREIEAAVNDLRRQQGMSREERREDLARRADEARGYSRGPNRVDQDVAIQIADGAGSRFALAGESMGQSAQGKMDRQSVVPKNPYEDSLFRSPATGVEYTKAEVTRMAGGDDRGRAMFRKLMHENLSRLNLILAGK